MEENIKIKSRAGKNLLKICMGDIYANPMVVYREYVQNSCDSLQEAEKLGYFEANVMKTVSIEISSDTITIHDRGIGVEVDNVERCLIDISFSQKNSNNIGRYGIGRLTGAKYCDEIVFETSAKGESKKSIVRFDAKKAREIIDSDEEYQINEVVDLVTSFTIEDENSERHYFRVTMNKVFERHLLDVEEAQLYLSETVPVDFTSDFKDYLLNAAFDNYPEFKTLYKSIPCCNVVVNGVGIRKLYERGIEINNGPEEKVGKIRFFKLENEDELLGWGWYAMTVTAKQFGNNVKFRKIRLRQLNMAVGDFTYFDNLYKKDADSPYFIGEIHATHPKIEPTTGREGLVDNTYKKIFERKVKELFERLRKEYNELSKFGSQVLDPLVSDIRQSKIEHKNAELDLTSPEEAKEVKEKWAAEVNKDKEKLAEYLKKIEKNGIISDLVSDIVEHYQELSDDEIDKYNEKKDTKNSNSQIKKVNIQNEVKKVVAEIHSQSQENPPSNTNGTDSNPTKPNDNPTGGSTPKKPEPPSELDVYKNLSKQERSLIKKIYKILDGQKDLPPFTRSAIKAKMVKKLTK